MEYSHNQIINLIKEGNKDAFEQTFRTFYKMLRAYAYTFIKDNEGAEEIIQNVFCRIWERRDQLKTDGSLRSYLYRVVHNESLSYLRHQKVKNLFQDYYKENTEEASNEVVNKILANELDRHIQRAIAELPQQCRIIFQMSRFEQLKYQQIADILQISIKTVENQMGKALKVLRLKLIEFLPVIIVLLHLTQKMIGLETLQ
ncbi:RNA polymerase sigma-70 factor (ECF subfamily) [Pedobacter cryoconitis]|uniref:RNA polymerase sigma-70 factor n=1 Tax=Pedobacter cryoconitis TaxID=188932 RepID=UPI0016211830|nr:RNA polymerase sigma-70 factor [Pedobacter cryoconitis]MBB6274538.1 RNA polymerase sigma-70 factor (ECF subfamily) [Pedobacter cryoconitis]